MSDRVKRRIDYTEYHRTGRKVDKVDDIDRQLKRLSIADTEGGSESSTIQIGEDVDQERITVMTEVAQLEVEEATISGDIDDFLDENEIMEIGTRVEDYDCVSKRVEDMRALYRGKHIQLKSRLDDDTYNGKYGEDVAKKLSILKEYIKELKSKKNT